jgi:hypothetical protein
MRSVVYSPFMDWPFMRSQLEPSCLVRSLSHGPLKMRCALAPPKIDTTALAKAAGAVPTVEWRPQ